MRATFETTMAYRHTPEDVVDTERSSSVTEGLFFTSVMPDNTQALQPEAKSFNGNADVMKRRIRLIKTALDKTAAHSRGQFAEFLYLILSLAFWGSGILAPKVTSWRHAETRHRSGVL